MPVVGEQRDRTADLIEALIEKLDEHLVAEPPVVNVEAPPPTIHVNPTSVTVPPPTVNVAPTVTPARGSWLFTVSRDRDGYIETITAKPS